MQFFKSKLTIRAFTLDIYSYIHKAATLQHLILENMAHTWLHNTEHWDQLRFENLKPIANANFTMFSQDISECLGDIPHTQIWRLKMSQKLKGILIIYTMNETDGSLYLASRS